MGFFQKNKNLRLKANLPSGERFEGWNWVDPKNRKSHHQGTKTPRRPNA
jgi:hypothetical protein